MMHVGQSLKKNISIYFLPVIFTVMILSCRNRDEIVENREKKDPTLTSAYEENDTLAFRKMPPNIRDWLQFYHQFDTGFRLINFKASGVVLHLDTLNPASGAPNEPMFKPVLAYSPDSSHLIDFWSYLRNIETDESGNLVMTGGGPDQEVIIVNKKQNKIRQLMYNGLSQTVETADWLDDDSFILGLVNSNETGQIWIPEIYLFNLSDSTFTNFRLNHEIPVDSLIREKADFSQHWLNQKNIRGE